MDGYKHAFIYTVFIPKTSIVVFILTPTPLLKKRGYYTNGTYKNSPINFIFLIDSSSKSLLLYFGLFYKYNGYYFKISLKAFILFAQDHSDSFEASV